MNVPILESLMREPKMCDNPIVNAVFHMAFQSGMEEEEAIKILVRALVDALNDLPESPIEYEPALKNDPNHRHKFCHEGCDDPVCYACGTHGDEEFELMKAALKQISLGQHQDKAGQAGQGVCESWCGKCIAEKALKAVSCLPEPPRE